MRVWSKGKKPMSSERKHLVNAPDEHGNIQQKEANVTFQQAADYKLLYANFAQSVFSPLDIAIIFGEVLTTEDEKVFVLTKARVTMTPMEAKILHTIVGDTVKNYENKFGEISIPPMMLPPKAQGV